MRRPAILRTVTVVLITVLVAGAPVAAAVGTGSASTATASVAGPPSTNADLGAAPAVAQQGSSGVNATPADEIWVDANGNAYLLYSEPVTGNTTVEYGVNTSEGLVYFVGDTALPGSVQQATGDAEVVVTPEMASGQSNFSVEKPTNLTALDVSASGTMNGQTSEADASARVVYALSGVFPGIGAGTSGRIAQTPNRVTISGDANASRTLIQLGLSGSTQANNQGSFTFEERSSSYVLDGQIEAGIDNSDAANWSTQAATKSTLESLLSAPVGTTTVTVNSHSFSQVSTTTSQLDTSFTVTYQGVDAAAVAALSGVLAQSQAFDLTSAEASSIANRVESANVEKIELTFDDGSTGSPGTATWNVTFTNYADATRAALDLADAYRGNGSAALHEAAQDARMRFEASQAAGLETRTRYSLNGVTTTGGVEVTASAHYDTTNWASYVTQLNNRGIAVSNLTFALQSGISGNRVETNSSFTFEPNGIAVNQSLQDALNGSNLTAEERRLLRALANSSFQKARLVSNVNSTNAHVEAGAAFDNLSAVVQALGASAGTSGTFTDAAAETSGASIDTYVRIEGLVGPGATAADVRATPWADSSTTVNTAGTWSRTFPSLDVNQARTFLNVSGSGGTGGGGGAAGTSVFLSPASEQTDPGTNTTFDVVVADAPNGVGTADYAVSIANTSAATFVDATASGSFNSNPGLSGSSVNASTATLNYASGDTPDGTNVTIGQVTVQGQANGSTSLSLSITTLGDEANSAINVSSTAGATLTVSPVTGPSMPVGNNPNLPTDPDGDGTFEDVNGDGQFDLIDVAVLYNSRNSAAVTSNGQYYDYDGSGGFDLIDVAVLYNEATGP